MGGRGRLGVHHLEAEPGYVEELGWSIERLGLGGRITLAGGSVDLNAAYNAADLLVIPSRAGACGMFVAQALARGIPVLANRKHGMGCPKL